MCIWTLSTNSLSLSALLNKCINHSPPLSTTIPCLVNIDVRHGTYMVVWLSTRIEKWRCLVQIGNILIYPPYLKKQLWVGDAGFSLLVDQMLVICILGIGLSYLFHISYLIVIKLHTFNLIKWGKELQHTHFKPSEQQIPELCDLGLKCVEAKWRLVFVTFCEQALVISDLN